MARLTKQKRLEKQARDMVDIALEWQRLAPFLHVNEDGVKQFELVEEMMSTVLKTYTNIEEKLVEKA